MKPKEKEAPELQDVWAKFTKKADNKLYPLWREMTK